MQDTFTWTIMVIFEKIKLMTLHFVIVLCPKVLFSPEKRWLRHPTMWSPGASFVAPCLWVPWLSTCALKPQSFSQETPAISPLGFRFDFPSVPKFLCGPAFHFGHICSCHSLIWWLILAKTVLIPLVMDCILNQTQRATWNSYLSNYLF